MQKGLRCSGSIPYGYKRTKDDKQQLYVDEPAAEVVRRIFRMACQGIGTTTIAEIIDSGASADTICLYRQDLAGELYEIRFTQTPTDGVLPLAIS